MRVIKDTTKSNSYKFIKWSSFLKHSNVYKSLLAICLHKCIQQQQQEQQNHCASIGRNKIKWIKYKTHPLNEIST